MYRLVVLVAVATMLLACGNNIDVIPGNGIGTADYSIINGSPPSRVEHSSVVGLHQLARGGRAVYTLPFCSGTLIEPNVVLTAAHCLQGQRASASKIAVYVGDDPSVDLTQHLYTVSEVAVHPGYNDVSITNDVALIRLDSSVSEVSAVPYHTSDNLVAGNLVNFAGFGQDENGDSGVKLQADGVLGSCSGNSYCSDPNTQLFYSQSGAGPCFGDSGGPMFVYQDSSIYQGPTVAGVTSYGDSNCAVYGVSTKVSSFISFIEGFMNGASCGADGVCDAECAPGEDPDCGGSECTDLLPTGASCVDNAECCSNKCKGKPGSRTCL